MEEGKIIETIENLVCTWAPNYQFSCCRQSPTEFCVTWSKPTFGKPIPDAVVHATITIDENTGLPNTWRLENQSFVHKVHEGIVFKEQWVDSIIEGKLICRDVATDLTATRGMHKRYW